MELETNANPHLGSDVRDAAARIEQSGLLEQSLTVDGELPEQAEASKVTQETEGETPEVEEPSPEAETSDTSTDETQQTEPSKDDETEELPDTLDGLAEAVGMSAQDFADHVSGSVTVNGETSVVTLNEALRGYQRQADYDRRMTDLREQRQAFNTATQQATSQWQQRFESLDGLTEQLQKAVTDDTGNLERILAEEGFEAHYAAKQGVDQKKELLDHAKAEREKAALETQEAQRVQTETYLREQNSLLVQALPEIADAEKGPKLQTRLRTYLQEVGFNEQEMKQLVDHRQVLVVRDAMRYRELKKGDPARKKKLSKLSNVLKPGAKPEKDDIARSKVAVNLQRLKKSGSREDAARTIEGIL